MEGYLKLQRLTGSERRVAIKAIRTQMLRRLGGRTDWNPQEATVVEFVRQSMVLNALALDRWLRHEFDIATRTYRDHAAEAINRSLVAQVDDESWMPAQADGRTTNKAVSRSENAHHFRLWMMRRGHAARHDGTHGKLWDRLNAESPTRKKRREDYAMERRKQKPDYNRRATIRRSAEHYFGFAGRGDGFNQYVDHVEELVAEQEQRAIADGLAEQALQRQELEMSDRELIALGDALDEHLERPMVLAFESWLKELEQKAAKRGWPEDVVPQGKVVVWLNRRKLVKNIVLITVLGLRRVRRTSTLSPGEIERVAKQLAADDALFYPGDGYAGHMVGDEDYIFDYYDGPDNSAVVDPELVFNHPATGGQTGYLSMGGRASTLGDDGVPADFRCFHTSPQRIRTSVARSRRA